MKKLISFLVFVNFLFLSYTIGAAEVPPMINYQGKMTTATGALIVDTTVTMEFKIYDDSTLGNILWQETQSNVKVELGIFNVLLGSVTPISSSVFDGNIRYFGVKVGDDLELTPRKRIASVGYALHSGTADTAYFSMPDADWVIDGDNIYHLNGNVGIGTTGPEEKLEVRGGNVLFRNDSGDSYLRLNRNIEDGTAGTGRILVTHSTSNQAPYAGSIHLEPLWYNGSNYEFRQGAFMVDASGNVGIGTTSPVYKLQVDGSSWSRQYFTDGVPVGNGSSYTMGKGDEFRFETTYGYAVAPVKIAVRGNFANDELDNQDALFLSFQRQDPSDYDAGYPYFFDIGQFGATKFRLDKYGNVGIGTTSPETRLHVQGTIRSRGHASDPYYADFASIYNYQESFFINIRGGDAAETKILGFGGNDTWLSSYGANKALNIKGFSGNVGIGTTSPAYKLDVAGDIRSTGTIYGNFSGTIDNALHWNGHSWGDTYPYSSNSDLVDGIHGTQFLRNDQPGTLSGSVGDYQAVLNVLNSGEGRCIYASTKASMNRNAAIYGDALDDGGAGVYGHTSSTGVSGGSSVGVFGLADTILSGGSVGGAAMGVFGRVTSYQKSPNSVPVGVFGEAMHLTGKAWGVAGETWSTNDSAAGVKGTLKTAGAHGRAIWGEAPTTGWAGYFQGNVNITGNINITGNLSKGSGTFKIDHPLDPANKYLSHSFVESPDMMNIYNGNVTLDANGEVWIDLPEWFEALNHDFRYQLTAIGESGPNLYIAQEISGNRFKIAGGKNGMKVSWQVTGVRKDAYAEKHRILVEEDKPPQERGKYLHPTELGMPETMGIDYHESGK